MPRIKPPRNAGPIPERPDHEPPTEPIDIVLGDEEPGEVQIDLAAPPAEEPEPQPRKITTPEPEPADDDALAKALDAQRRAEELQRTAQRERDEAIRRAKERDEELIRERGDREEAQYNSVLTAIAAEQGAVARAKADFANAMVAQDFAAAAEAQAAMASAAARLDRLEDGKVAFESKRETAKTEKAETRREPARPDFEQQIATLPDNARAWLRKHPEFITDTAKNNEIGSAHNYLINRRKVEPFSDAYFDALDEEFGFKTAAAAPAEPVQPQRRSLPMSAPVSRQAPSPSGQRQNNSMTLTAEERAIARNSFTATDMSNAQKEFLYAKNKQRYQAMKANGQYTEQKQ